MFFKRRCPSCDKQMHKLADFCRHCGTDNPDAIRHCMHCGKEVAGDSTNCWNCGDNLRKQPRGMVFSDRWVREEGVFAVRIPIETPGNRLRHGVFVDAGVRAVVYHEGSYLRHLKPGYDPLTTFLARLFGLDRTRSTVDAILALSGPFDCHVNFTPADDIYVEGLGRFSSAQLVLSLQLARIEDVHQKFLMSAGAYQVLQSELLKSFKMHLADSVRIWLGRMSLDDVLNQKYDYLELAGMLRQKLALPVGKHGLEILSVENFSLPPEDLQEAREKKQIQEERDRHHQQELKKLKDVWKVFAPPGQAEAAAAARRPFLKWKKQYEGCVGILVTTYTLAGMKLSRISGTAWVPARQPAGKNVVFTNAHVVEQLEESREEGGEITVIFSGTTTRLPLGKGLVHPLYRKIQPATAPVPAYDVGAMPVLGVLPRPGLTLAPRQVCKALQGGEAIASLGFPSEGQAGGGTNVEHPQVSFREGSISKLETWEMRAPTNPDEALLVTHDIPIAGGVSGSPLFDESGRVVAMISAGNMEMIYDPKTGESRRTPSASQVNFAQRIDILLDWLY